MAERQQAGVEVAARPTGSAELCRRGSSQVVVMVGGSRVVLSGVLVPARPAWDAGQPQGSTASVEA